MATDEADDTEQQEKEREALLSALVTEHFVLQSIRGTASSEAASRASLYLATLSGAMIALGFVSGSNTHLGAFLGGLLPVVFLLGLITFARLVALGIQDIERLQDIQHIHAFYREISPSAQEYFRAVDWTDPRAVVSSMGLRAGPLQLFSTAAATVAVVNGVVGAIGVAVALNALHVNLAVAVVVGVVVALALVAGCLRYQWVMNVRAFATS